MEVYTENTAAEKDACSPYSVLFSFFKGQFVEYGSGSYQAAYNEYQGQAAGTTSAYLWAYSMAGTMSSGANVAEIYTNEYRPNAAFSNAVFKLVGLHKVNSITPSTFSDQRTYTGAVLPASVYSVSYKNDTTIITWDNPLTAEQYYEGEFFENYISGYPFRIDIQYIGGSRPNAKQWTADIVSYPTSAAPISQKVVSAANRVLATAYTAYNFNLNTPSANAQPLTSTAEWKISIDNTSPFKATNAKLPHSWVALQCAEGILGDNVELWDATGTTKLGDFIKVGSSNY